MVKPRDLTKDLIHTMRRQNEKNVKFSGILQVLKIKDQGYVVLSDGYSFSECASLKGLREKFAFVKDNDIAFVSLIFHNSIIDVITAFELVYPDVNKQIGMPIPYAEYLERECINPDGDNAIPRVLWDEKKAAKKEAETHELSSREAAIKTTLAEEDMHKIGMLTTGQNEFLIKVKVITKSKPKEYPQGKGTSRLFNIRIADDTGEIQGTFFSHVAEKYIDAIEVGKVYIISGGEVRKASKYNAASNPNEISFNNKTLISLCDDANYNIKKTYNLVKIGEVVKMEKNFNIDLLCKIAEVGHSSNISLKTGEIKQKQTFKGEDDSQIQIEINLWGEFPDAAKIKPKDIVLFCGLTVSEYNKTKVLNSKSTTEIIVDPSDEVHPRVAEVRKWGLASTDPVKVLTSEKVQRDNFYISINQLKNMTEFIDSSLQTRPIYTITGYITSFGQTFTYNKCPDEKCFKKVDVIENGNNEVSSNCAVHGMIDKPPVLRYIGNIRVTDHTNWVYLNYNTDQVGQVVFGCPPTEIVKIAQNEEELKTHLDKRAGRYTFKVSAKIDSFRGEDRTQYKVINCFDQEGNKLKYENIGLLNSIQKLQDNLFPQK